MHGKYGLIDPCARTNESANAEMKEYRPKQWEIRLGRKNMNEAYVHGYNEEEAVRLHDQANALTDLLHCDTIFPEGAKVLEAGCGVGAQTVILAPKNPKVDFLSIDRAVASLAEAARKIKQAGIRNVRFLPMDIYQMDFPPKSFDHVFVCFVLEHLANPALALDCLKLVLKPGGTITVIEGDHGSAYFYPRSEAAQRAIQCQVELQRKAGGNALIGRELFPLLSKAGFLSVRVSPRTVYVDASRPRLQQGFIKETFTAMIAGIQQDAIEAGLIDATLMEQGIKDLYRTAEPDGVFSYTFFKAMAQK
jgi:2-polyprenyl-3-methyl-5-hydroxy-6-metoxy-1,4-benzoquinol methylase